MDDTMISKMVGTLALPAIVAGVLASLQPAAAAPPQPNGETLFRQRCQACHSASADKRSPLGPNLSGVVGRKAGSTDFRYSPALKASGLTWNRQTLDRFLAAPTKAVPGTRMVVAVPDGAQRSALIGYLQSRK